jgi:toxin ParE1/3/4
LSDKAKCYELTPKAIADLDDIWRYSAETWSLEQADRHIDAFVTAFEMLVEMPGLARERTEFAPPVRIHIHGPHLIIYIWDQELVSVIRVLGGKQNWRGILDALE